MSARSSRWLSCVIFQLEFDVWSPNMLIGAHRMSYLLTIPEIREFVEHLAKLRRRRWEVPQLIRG